MLLSRLEKPKGNYNDKPNLYVYNLIMKVQKLKIENRIIKIPITVQTVNRSLSTENNFFVAWKFS